MTLGGYSRAQRSFHWLTAVLVVAMAATGMGYFLDIGGDMMIVAHQGFGQLLILVLIGRVLVRVRSAHPAPLDHTPWERRAARFVHIGLYLILAAYVVTGYVSASAFSTPFLVFPADRGFARSDTGEWLLEIHYSLKWVLLTTLVVHLAAVAKHALIDKDTTFSRMWINSG